MSDLTIKIDHLSLRIGISGLKNIRLNILSNAEYKEKIAELL